MIDGRMKTRTHALTRRQWWMLLLICAASSYVFRHVPMAFFWTEWPWGSITTLQDARSSNALAIFEQALGEFVSAVLTAVPLAIVIRGRPLLVAGLLTAVHVAVTLLPALVYETSIGSAPYLVLFFVFAWVLAAMLDLFRGRLVDGRQITDRRG